MACKDKLGQRQVSHKHSWRAKLFFTLGLLSLLIGAVLQSATSHPTALRWMYPLKHQSLICKYAGEHQLSPTLVAALIHRESNFRDQARSQVGALGLMQIMPSTGQWVAQCLLLEQLESPEHLLSVDKNIRIGTSYLGYLRSRFSNQPVAYLAAYNAGPESLSRWSDDPTRLTVSQIGFPETRSYVKAVLADQKAYRRLYGESLRGCALEPENQKAFGLAWALGRQ